MREDRKRQRQRLRFNAKMRCRFCRRRIEIIDYKDVETLQSLCSPQGKILSRKQSGNCAKHQRQLKKAIVRARIMALLPFVG